MVRKTFGPSGNTIIVTNGTDTESERITVNDIACSTEQLYPNDSGTNGDAETIDGSNIGEDSGETGENSNDAGKFIDPATISPRTGKPKRTYTKRSKPGAETATKTNTKSAAIVTANLEKVLLNLHIMGAAMLGEPELEISKDDAELLAEAVKEVATAYDFTEILNPKTQALVDLGIACTTVYGGRVVNVWKKHATHKPNVVAMQQRGT